MEFKKKLILTAAIMGLGIVSTQAQTETVATINGKKITINPNSIATANNGLTAASGNVQLGGALTQPSVLTTSSAFTLALKGLQAGAAADKIVVTDANGILKMVDQSSITGIGDNLGNHIAAIDLNMSGKNINNINTANMAVANIVTAANIKDRQVANTNDFILYKNAGIFGLFNPKNNRNEISVDEITGKTMLTSAQIAKGTDGVVPAAGYVATAVDAAGNIVWKAPSTSAVSGVVVINANYTVADADYSIIASKIPGDITITLPAAAAAKGRVLVINQNNVANAAGNEVTVKFNVPVIYSDKLSINELTTSYYSATGGTLKVNLQSNGVNWYAVSSL